MKAHEAPAMMLEKFVKVGIEAQIGVQRKCSHCGMTFGEFRAQGTLGCPHDYEEFGDLLLPLIERVHDGASQHVGKAPGEQKASGERRAKVLSLRRALEKAVEAEEYEQAAELRDELMRLEAEDSNEHQ